MKVTDILTTCAVVIIRVKGGVYMIPGQLSPQSEFTPVPSHASIFVYMIPPQISCWSESTRREFTPVLVPGENFTPVGNLATVSCKHEITTRFGVKSVCR